LKPVNVTLGVITYDPVIDRHFDYIANVILAEVNAYAESKGYRYRFDYAKQKTTGIQEALEKGVRDLNQKRDVEVFLGFDESEAMCASLSYAISNHLILMGVPLIHHDSSALPGDVMFRVSPNLRQIHGVAVSLVEEMGVEAVLVVSRGDSWGDGVTYAIEEALGGDNVATVRYEKDTTDYSGILKNAFTQLAVLSSTHGTQQKAVVLISADETSTILEEAEKYPAFASTTWIILNESPAPYNIESTLPDPSQIDALSHRTLSIQMAPILDNSVFVKLQEGYTAESRNDTLGLIDASFHDSIWVACLSVLEANTTDAEVLKGVILGVAEGYVGATGAVRLDANGDRAVDYYIYELGNNGWVKIGAYDAASGVVSLEN